MRLVLIFILFLTITFSHALDNNKINNSVCTLTQMCRANICIYECLEDNISYNKYTMQYNSIEEAYASWIELTGIDFLLKILPKEEKIENYEQITILYKWNNKNNLWISIYEKDKILTGSLHIYKIDKQIIVDDKINFLQ